MDLALVAYVAFGGAVGSAARYALTVGIQSRLTTPFPVATLLINVAGSLLLGFIARLAVDTSTMSPETRLLLTTGFCGGFTTFSTFSYETMRLVEDGDYRRASLYAVSSLVLSLGGTLAGFALARAFVSARRGGA